MGLLRVRSEEESGGDELGHLGGVPAVIALHHALAGRRVVARSGLAGRGAAGIGSAHGL